ncbi:Thioredoxin reductase 3 [Echinococcus granulosus]|uniref:thioredoxin-disulfide reductase (NADPH) n=1 Tax=Echinococcus granulosus TaxID=6210 RepID=W6UPS4_ECHGR|nr:Thioredoxin reductase 3 [Echinococcus granulosus]EUB63258.1 Thioredoxin reductase 3 [Echinococcus granulosus]
MGTLIKTCKSLLKKTTQCDQSMSITRISTEVARSHSRYHYYQRTRRTAMAPIGGSAEQVEKLRNKINNAAVLVFAKSFCPYCKKVMERFNNLKIPFGYLDLDLKKNGSDYQKMLQEITGRTTVPQVFFRGEFIGGCDDVMAIDDDTIVKKANEMKYDYDMVIIGGGSGGLALAKESAKSGAKVALLDFVVPTPMGTTWGLGGTCVNVGCIPKKLMHQAALLNHYMEDAKSFGWDVDKGPHDWVKMVEGIQDHIHALNFGYRSSMMNANVKYLNALGEIVDPHTIKTTNKQGIVKNITTNTIIVATGERPRYPPIPGAKEYGITSDDLFSLDHNPGKTLCVGASYVSLECAGFLSSIGCDVTVMVRSIFLRGFDQQMAGLVSDYMAKYGVKFVRPCVPTSVRCLEEYDPESGKLAIYEVEGKHEDGTPFKDTFNTVLFAVGRDPCTTNIGLQNVDVKTTNGRVVVDDEERTNVPNIYAIGDVNNAGYQLTPLAIQAGKNLARRLYTADDCRFSLPSNMAALVFPRKMLLANSGKTISRRVFHSYFQPLEWTVPHRPDNTCYAKLIINKQDDNRVVGFHVFGPNAGEVTQGYAVAMHLGARKEDFDRTIGIHPTCSETFTTLRVTKSSGASATVTGC